MHQLQARALSYPYRIQRPDGNLEGVAKGCALLERDGIFGESIHRTAFRHDPPYSPEQGRIRLQGDQRDITLGDWRSLSGSRGHDDDMMQMLT